TLPVDEELEEIEDYFDRGGVLQLADTAQDDALLEGLSGVPALMDVVERLDLDGDGDSAGARAAAGELVLEALVAEKRISRNEAGRYARGRQRRQPPGGGPQFPGTLEA
ncbi:MAG: hypothetical protein R3314_01665, partial [Longimicrobiales bacterium]|nr:hypothetical protein [Longimicrobiales bacterium]